MQSECQNCGKMFDLSEADWSISSENDVCCSVECADELNQEIKDAKETIS